MVQGRLNIQLTATDPYANAQALLCNILLNCGMHMQHFGLYKGETEPANESYLLKSHIHTDENHTS